jgi:hypothetical protein
MPPLTQRAAGADADACLANAELHPAASCVGASLGANEQTPVTDAASAQCAVCAALRVAHRPAPLSIPDYEPTRPAGPTLLDVLVAHIRTVRRVIDAGKVGAQ